MPQGFPFKAVIFDMDGVIVDTEMNNIGVQVDFGRHLGLEVSAESLMEPLQNLSARGSTMFNKVPCGNI